MHFSNRIATSLEPILAWKPLVFEISIIQFKWNFSHFNPVCKEEPLGHTPAISKTRQETRINIMVVNQAGVCTKKRNRMALMPIINIRVKWTEQRERNLNNVRHLVLPRLEFGSLVSESKVPTITSQNHPFVMFVVSIMILFSPA